jgi:hypothetical protein
VTLREQAARVFETTQRASPPGRSPKPASIVERSDRARIVDV